MEVPTIQARDVASGDLLCAEDGTHHKVSRVFSRIVVLHELDSNGDRCGIRKIPHASLAKYQKADIPKTLKKGQVLYCMGSRCVVTGFMKPCFVPLTGAFGSRMDRSMRMQFRCQGIVSSAMACGFLLLMK